MDFRKQDRMELKALVDYYATESDKNNQDCYVEIFRPDVKLNVYFGGKLGMQVRDVQDMIPVQGLRCRQGVIPHERTAERGLRG